MAGALVALIPLAWKQERRRPIVPLDEGTIREIFGTDEEPK